MNNLHHIDEDKYYFDEKAANRAVDFIEMFCQHVKGDLAGKRFILEDWQKDDIIKPLFGWKSKTTNLRKFRQCFVFIPRKNGKTNLMVGIALYMLFSDGEKGAEIVSAAADKEQARLSFSIAKQMVLQEPELIKRSNTYRDSITYDKVGSYYKVISADADTKHGLNLSCCLLDEIHSHKNRDLYDVLLTSMGARKEPLMLGITTAGAGHQKDHICKELYDYAKKLISGAIQDDSFLGVVYEADKDDDIFDEQVWRKANPGFGTIITEEYMKQQAVKAKNEPSYENTFRRLHLNQWVANETKWISDEKWMDCYDDISESNFVGKPCYVGLDLASTRDITCLSLLFPDNDNGYDIFLHSFIPSENAHKRSERDKVDYVKWQREGWVTFTEGDVCDYNYIKQKIRDLSELYDIRMIAYDRWNASQIVIDLTEEGCPMIPVGQGYRTMSPATKEFETLVLGGNIRHNGNPALRWMMSNVVLALDPAGNVKPNKAKSNDKIDGVVSTLMGLSEAMQNKNGGNSGYDDKEIFFI
jgi:phage terminase large subunit-like protein